MQTPRQQRQKHTQIAKNRNQTINQKPHNNYTPSDACRLRSCRAGCSGL